MRAQRVGIRVGAALSVAAAVTMVGLAVPAVGIVQAAGPFTVNSTADAPDANAGDGRCAATNGACTLRAAVEELGSTAAGGSITLPAGYYTLNAGVASRALQFKSNITLTGVSGAGNTVIAGAGGARVLDVQNFAARSSLSVSVSGVTISGGSDALGAGIFTGRDVNFSLADSVVSGNLGAGGDSKGGGLFAYGEPGYTANITLTRVTFSGNKAVQGGAIVSMYPVSMTINDSTIVNNVAFGPYAGGIRSLGTMTMNNSTVIGNYAGFGNSAGAPGGGGVYTGNPPSPASGQVSTFTMNGGSIVNNSLPLNLLSSGGGLLNETGGTATLNSVTITGNSAFTGGGVLNDEGNININASNVSSNSAFYGAGVYNNDFIPSNGFGAYMTIRQSTVSGNTASDSGCPYQLIPEGNLCGAGGGVFNENADLVVVNSTIAENSAGTFGGGIYNLRLGGGASNTRLFNATVSANFAGRDGGGLLGNLGPFVSKNSIVAGNSAGFGPSDCFAVPGSPMYSSGNNITTDGRCGFNQAGDRIGSAQLAPLQVNGGGTATMVPLSGSQAIGTGDNAACGASPVGNVDQRGVRRPVGNVCDIGAVEGESAPPAPTNTARPATYVNGVFSFRTATTSGPATSSVMFGLPTDTPMMCDFNGDGTRSVTVVRVTGGYLTWFGRNSNVAGPAETIFAFGAAGDTPVCGDWDGNGTDTPGLLRNVGGARQWFQSNQPNGTGALNIFYFGAASDNPTFGDWDGNGTDTPGITRPAGYAMLWSYRNTNASGITDGEFYFGINTDRTLVGDWDNDGADSPGVARNEGLTLRWWFRNTIVNGVANGTFLYGGPFDRTMIWKGAGVGGY